MTSRKREDQQSGRRETLRLLGAAGVTALVGGGGGQIINLWPAGQPDSSVEAATLPGALRSALFSPPPSPPTKHVSQLTCVVKPALTEGPYFVDELLNRSDIRSDPLPAPSGPACRCN